MDGVNDGDLRDRLRRLEEAGEQLREANLQLARGWLGSSEAAAASARATAQARIEALEAEVERLSGELTWSRGRIEELTEVAARNDALYQQQVAWNDAARYRLADRIAERLGRSRVLRAVVRAGRWIEAHAGR